MKQDRSIIPANRIEKSILLLRGQKVMLDTDLADLYQVPTKVLNQAVRRNKDRFPADFMFQLTADEFSALRSQIVTLDTAAGNIANIFPTHLLNRVSPCYRVFCEASRPLMSTLK
jgi:hypothetical protein